MIKCTSLVVQEVNLSAINSSNFHSVRTYLKPTLSPLISFFRKNKDSKQFVEISQTDPLDPRCGHISFAHNGTLYIFGGSRGSDFQYPQCFFFHFGNQTQHFIHFFFFFF